VPLLARRASAQNFGMYGAAGQQKRGIFFINQFTNWLKGANQQFQEEERQAGEQLYPNAKGEGMPFNLSPPSSSSAPASESTDGKTAEAVKQVPVPAEMIEKAKGDVASLTAALKLGSVLGGDEAMEKAQEHLSEIAVSYPSMQLDQS